MVTLTAACGSDPPVPTVDSPAAAPGPGVDAGPVVEVVPAAAALPPLDPTADPRTPLGELRAGYLPIWSPDFDWAFPPEVCGSAWELDAIAEPASTGDHGVLGDVSAAAALSVMRYEYLLSHVLTAPDVLGQLCVAVAAVGSARADGLGLLAAHLDGGTRSADRPSFPDEVTIVAAGPAGALAVACTTLGHPGAGTSKGEFFDEAPVAASLRAFLLTISVGLEDAVQDLSYRVSGVTNRAAGTCAEMDAWAAEWAEAAKGWAAEGQIWTHVGRTVSTEELCDSPPPGGPNECPRRWGV